MSSSSASTVAHLFKEQVHEHEELKVKHAELQRQHEAALRVANDHQHALQARQQEVERSSELVESLRKSLSQYVGACALHSSFADGNLTSAEREETGRAADAAQQRELRLLEQLDGKTAELDALRTLGPDLAAARARIAELETECDRAHAAARRSDHAAKEQEVKVNELNKRLLSQREAIGRSEMEHMRAKDEMQLHLKQLADKLRHEKMQPSHQAPGLAPSSLSVLGGHPAYKPFF